MEKHGLRAEQEAIGLTTSRGLAWADEMRGGLIGQTRRVWASVGVTIVHTVEDTSQWQSLVLAVNGVSGRLWWDWTSDMTSRAVAGGAVGRPGALNGGVGSRTRPWRSGV